VSWSSELDVARRAAAAGASVVAGFPRDAMGVRGKRAYDPVTRADTQSQEAVLAVLARETPDVAVLAEEDHDTTTRGRPRWIVDPLDGTTNFVHGVPQVAVSVALEVDGRVVVGVTHDVFRGEVWGAVRGGGASLDGRPIRVSEVADPERALVGLGFPSGPRRADVRLGWLAAALREVGCVRRCGAATLDLAWVAGGRLDGFVELGLAPWDTAAGALLIEEAGGRVTGLRGQAFTPGDPWVLASNGPLHACMRRWLAEEAGA
jgi:myo-inositol-1(or 4)-monophosphatase